MSNMTLEEAIGRITLSTQIDPPGTKIILRRDQGTDNQHVAPATGYQAEQQTDPVTGSSDGSSTACMQTEASASSSHGPADEPRTYKPKDVWNRQQLELGLGTYALA